MAIKVHLQKEAAPIFARMAREAGMRVSDLAEIACYNLIAIWTNEHGTQLPDDVRSPFAHNPSESSDLPK